MRPIAAARCDMDYLLIRYPLPSGLGLAAAAGVVDRGVEEAFGCPPVGGPIAIGHECVAEVIEHGPEVRGFTKGARVIVPFQISCGACHSCRRGLTSRCENSGSCLSAYGFGAGAGGWGGVVSDVVRVPHADHMLVALPDALTPQRWRALATISRTPGVRWHLHLPNGPARDCSCLAAARGPLRSTQSPSQKLWTPAQSTRSIGTSRACVWRSDSARPHCNSPAGASFPAPVGFRGVTPFPSTQPCPSAASSSRCDRLSPAGSARVFASTSGRAPPSICFKCTSMALHFEQGSRTHASTFLRWSSSWRAAAWTHRSSRRS